VTVERESRWQRSPHVLWRRSLDAVLLVAPGGDAPSVLDGLAPVVWELLAEERSVEAMVATLSDLSSAGFPVAERDVGELIEQLVELGVVRRAPEPPVMPARDR
jgi:hypothetical protein